MQCLQLFMLLGLQWVSMTIVLGARRNTVSTVTAPSVSSSTTFPRRSRVFSNAGIHEVEAPKLGRPGATPPPPPPVVRQHIPEISSSGFKPIYSTRRPSRRRQSPPPSLDYGTDIITIYDLDKNRNHQVNNNTWVRTVSSTIQVKDDAKPGTVSRGKVFDDVIYDYNASPGDSFKPQETIVDVRRLRPMKDTNNRNTNSWKKLSSSEVYSL